MLNEFVEKQAGFRVLGFSSFSVVQRCGVLNPEP